MAFEFFWNKSGKTVGAEAMIDGKECAWVWVAEDSEPYRFEPVLRVQPHLYDQTALLTALRQFIAERIEIGEAA